MHDDNPETTETSLTHDPKVASLLAAAKRRRKLAAGPEPDDLMTVARWVDGELSPERRTEVANRVGADPELRAMVETLAAHDIKGSEVGTRQAPSPASNVVSLADHARKSAADKRGKAEQATGRAASRVLIGGGSLLMLAAILFLAIRTTPQSPGSLAGASVGAGGTVGLRGAFAQMAPGGTCEVTGVLSADAPKALWYVTLEGATSLGERAPGPFRLATSCASSTCEALVATRPGASAPSLDPATCAPSDPALTGIRLTR